MDGMERHDDAYYERAFYGSGFSHHLGFNESRLMSAIVATGNRSDHSACLRREHYHATDRMGWDRSLMDRRLVDRARITPMSVKDRLFPPKGVPRGTECVVEVSIESFDGPVDGRVPFDMDKKCDVQEYALDGNAMRKLHERLAETYDECSGYGRSAYPEESELMGMVSDFCRDELEAGRVRLVGEGPSVSHTDGPVIDRTLLGRLKDGLSSAFGQGEVASGHEAPEYEAREVSVAREADGPQF